MAEKVFDQEGKTTEKGLGEIFDRITDGFLSFDTEWRFTYLNAEGARTLGRTPEELLGKNLWEEFPELAETDFGKLYLRAVRENVPLSLEGYYPPFDAWFHARAYPSESGLSLFFLNVTERKKVEEALKKSENQLQAITDVLPVLISYVDADLYYRFVNKGYTEWFQKNREEVVGKHIRDVIGEAAYEAVTPRLKKVLSGEEAEFEQLMPYLGNKQRFIHVNYIPDIDSETGKVKGFYSLVRDISESKQAEEKLRESEERFSKAFNASPLVLTISSLKTGKLLEVNETFVNVTGFTREEAIGRTTVELGLWAKLDDRQQEMETVRQTGQIRNAEYLFRGRDSREIVGLLSAERIEIGGETFALTVIQDITDRKKTVESLRESEERLRIATEAANMFVWETNYPTNVIKWSENASQLIGRDSEELPTIAGSGSFFVLPEDRQILIDGYERAVREGRDRYNVEFRGYNKANELRTWLAQSSIMRDENGNPARVIGVTQDITERKREQLDREFLLELGEKIRYGEFHPEHLLDEVTEMISKHLDAARCLFIEINEAENRGIIRHEYCRSGISSVAQEYKISDYSPETLKQSRNGQIIVNNDAQNDPRTADIFETVYQPYDERAYISIPLFTDGRWTAIFWISDDKARNWMQQEITFLETVGERVWLAIEKVRNDEALRQSRERLRMAMEAAQIYTWEMNLATQEIQWSSNLEQVIGFALPQEFGVTVNDFVHHEDREPIQQKILEAIDTGKPFASEFRLVNPHNGEIIWVRGEGIRITDAKDKQSRFVGITKNITERKRAELNAQFLAEISQEMAQVTDEDQLAETVGKKLNSYLNVSVCAFIEIDEKATQVTINHEWHSKDSFALTGVYNLSEFVSDEFRRAVSGGEVVVIRDVFNDWRVDKDRFLKLNIGSHVNVPLIKDGQWKFTLGLYHTKPCNWREDEIELVRELALRIWTLIERIRAEEKLRDSEQKYRNLANAMPQLVWTANADGVVDYYNSLATNYEGINLNKVTQTWSWQPVVHPDEIEATVSAWQQAQETGTYEFEHRIKMADGTYRWHLSRALAVKDSENNRVIKWFGTATDINELKVAESELERLLQSEQTARGEAEEANRLKDEFLATVSHELRTPLNAILGWSAMAQSEGLDAQTSKHAFEVIERNARNQSQIIADILDVSRIITGKLNIDAHPIELVPVIQTAIDTVRPALHAKNIRLSNKLAFDDVRVIGDSSRLQQIVWNLLSNSVKFTPQNGQIEVSLRYTRNFAEITVKDSGSGIEAEFLPFVFDRFRQADGGTNRRHGGLGLGLAIVKHLIELHGGNVSAASEGHGQGATFTVTLPLEAKQVRAFQQTESETLPGKEAESARQKLAPLNGLNILIVDDEPDAIELVNLMLTTNGAEVIFANSVEEALLKLDERIPDFIISDIGMPERDGYDFIQTIRTRPTDKGGLIPAIALTAYARSEDSQRALKAGYQAHLPKPVEVSKLVQVISNLIKESNS